MPDEVIKHDRGSVTRSRWMAFRKRRVWTALGAGALCIAAAIGLWRETLPAFDEIREVPARKAAFFEYLAPIVLAENERVLAQRTRLEQVDERLRDAGRLGWRDRRWLAGLAEEYEIEFDREAPEAAMPELLLRVDTVPVPLALVQAAKESAWGRSRFAREGFNLFGHWCFEAGCGFVPRRRDEGRTHEVASFRSAAESVSRYLHNLNTHPAYGPLRELRRSLRQSDEPPTAVALTAGLGRYSERRADYVSEIRSLLRSNREIIERVLSATTGRR